MNVFRKRLRAEFGKKVYRHFVCLCREELEQKNNKVPEEQIVRNEKVVYLEMCRQIQSLTKEEIEKKKERLAGTLMGCIPDCTSIWLCICILCCCQHDTGCHGTGQQSYQYQSCADGRMLPV